MMHRTWIVTGLVALVAALPSAQAATEAPVALDVAFRFASAIDADPKDKARAQEQVVRDLIALDRLDEALRRAGAIDGWRQGVALADLAEAFALGGREDEARDLIARAEAVRMAVRGWQNPRIASHVAKALAVLGETGDSRRLLTSIVEQDAQQYAGRAATTRASAAAARGDYDVAMARLAELDGEKDVYVTWWRTVTYVEIARDEQYDRGQRLAALEAAEGAAEAVIGWKRAEALAAVAEEAAGLGRTRRARTLLREAESIVDGMAEQGFTGPRVMVGAAVARAWAALGDDSRAVDVLETIRPTAEALLAIERPAALAVIGAAYWLAGDEMRARAAYDAALEVTEGLVNARPRALAVVDICRTLGRFEIPLADGYEDRFDRLYAGLEEPW